MVILLIILVFISLWGVKLKTCGDDYMSYHATNAIKGVFVVLVLFSHLKQYIQLGDTAIDQMFRLPLSAMGQLMVAIFLFYSGFGIVRSAQNNERYFTSFPRKRIVKTLLHFDVAIVWFLLLSLATGQKYPIHCYFFCWVGWSSIGNSNWFIFDILLLYGLTYIAYLISCHYESHAKLPSLCTIVTILSIPSWFFLATFRDGQWWIDTFFCFSVGMWYATCYRKISGILYDKLGYWMLMMIVSVAFSVCYYFWGVDKFGICSSLFCFFVVFLSYKVKIDNKILQWLGTNVFSIYIIQRIPMNSFAYFGLNANPYVFAVISIPSILICAFLLSKFLKKLDIRFFS